MAGPLMTFLELQKRPGFHDVDQEAAEVTIDDASALVRDIAETDWSSSDVPEAVVPVVAAMVRRGLHNPMGYASEMEGGTQVTGGGSLYATKREKAIIRKQAGTLGIGEVQLEGYMPLHRHDLTTDLTGSL